MDIKQAQSLHQQGRIPEALACYEALHHDNPRDILAIQLLCLCLVQTHQLDRAKSFLNNVIQSIPEDASLWNTLGNLLSRQDQLDAAINAYERALAITPDYPGALNNLGNVYYRMDDFAKAQSCYSKALEIDPDYPDAHFNAARLYMASDPMRNEQYQAAEQHLEHAIRIAPEHAGAHSLMARLYIQSEISDNIAKAISHLEKRLAIQPHHADSHQALGIAWMKNGNRSRALQHYLRHLEYDKNVNSLYNIGVILSDQQRHHDAIDYFEQVLSIDSQHLPALLNVGALYLKHNRINDALERYQKALAIDPSDAEVQHIIDALTENSSSPAAPASYVSHLFDHYAPAYDAHMIQHLHYQIPSMIRRVVVDVLNPREKTLKILDLGCGTGLMGQEIASFSRHLVGIDLSEGMLNLAKQKNIYMDLVHGPIDITLSARDRDFDLVIAADVFPYMGELQNLFSNIVTTLKADGVFIFTVEKTDTMPFVLQKNVRYAHHKEYVRTLAEMISCEVLSIDNAILRQERNRPVEGYLVVLKKR